MPVDYYGVCSNPIQNFDPRSPEKTFCRSVICARNTTLLLKKCSSIIYPPGACCPFCGTAFRALYSSAAATRYLADTGDLDGSVSVRIISSKLSEMIQPAVCEIFVYLSSENELVVLIMPITSYSLNLLIIKICKAESTRLQRLIESESPLIKSILPLSLLAAAIEINPHVTTNSIMFKYLNNFILFICLVNKFHILYQIKLIKLS